MSKSFAMAGSRVGWIVGPEDAIHHLANLAINTTYGVPGYIEDAAVFALGAGAALEGAVCAPFHRQRNLARALVERQALVKSVPADGAMYLLLDIHATGLSGIAFAKALLEAERIAVMPGESLGAAAAGHVRLALTVDADRPGRCPDPASRFRALPRGLTTATTTGRANAGVGNTFAKAAVAEWAAPASRAARIAARPVA